MIMLAADIKAYKATADGKTLAAMATDYVSAILIQNYCACSETMFSLTFCCFTSMHVGWDLVPSASDLVLTRTISVKKCRL